MKKIAYLGTGAWGFCLARLLAKKGHQITAWSIETELLKELSKTKEHPYLKGLPIQGEVSFTEDLEKALSDCDVIIESVSAGGVRPVFEQIQKIGIEKNIPIVMTSKGIEQHSDLILSDVVLEVLGEEFRHSISSFSGPSFAFELAHELPTACVVTGYNHEVVETIRKLFTTPFLRVYPCYDVRGVAFGGAMKNIIAIACGIAEGMNAGSGAKAALITRGLHEIVKLAVAAGAQAQTLYGLSGMGDLVLTCSSPLSRNYRFGELLSKNIPPEEAKKEIGMVVEGAYSVISATELAKKHNVPMPISEGILAIIEGKTTPQKALDALMKRKVKEEAL